MSSKATERFRNDARLLNVCANFAKDRANSPRLLELKKTNNLLKTFVVEKRTGGQRLTQIAALLLLTPDPITDAAAIPVLMAAGIVKMRSEKRNELQRVVEGVRGNITSLLSSSSDLGFL